ncbi:MAG: ABC transporter substrate-binding protein [Planctomycetes bacterium]|nr:ABC transporter substrate-binding protein [Planctomycetota bacterium]
MVKKKKFSELTQVEKQNRRAKAEAESEKAFKQDVRRSKYFTYIMVFVVLAILVGSFIVPRSGTGKGAYFYVAIPLDSILLDPQKAHNSWEAGVCSLIYEGLVKSDEKLLLEQDLEAFKYASDFDEKSIRFGVEPALATSWRYQADDLSWTFTLRQDVRFHDTNNFTAASVVASFARLLGFEDINVNTDVEFPIRKLFSTINKVYKIGDFEVVFELNQFDPFFLQKLALPQAAIISSKHLSREKTTNIDLSTKTSGTGPYLLGSLLSNNYLFLGANEHYWGNKAYPGINIYFIDNDNTALNAIENEELDMILAGTILTSSVASKNDNLETFKGFSRFQTSVVMNPFAGDKTAKLLATKGIREIVFNSVDLQEFFSKNMFEFYDKYQLPGISGNARTVDDELNINKALQTRKYSDEKKLEIELTYPLIQTGYLPDLTALAQTFKQQLAEVNISVKLKILPEKVFFEEWLQGRIALTFADFSDDWIYSLDNFYACALKDKEPEIAQEFMKIHEIQDAVILRKKLSESRYFKVLGHLLRVHILISEVAGKSPDEIHDFFGLLKTAD